MSSGPRRRPIVNDERTREHAAMESRRAAARRALNRLRRAHGQLAAVIAAVEGDAPCRETVLQLAAVSKALDRAGYLLISNALTQCLRDPASPGAEGPEELERLFLALA